jgi:hypothetical protein
MGPSVRVYIAWYVSNSFYLTTPNGYYKSSDGVDWVKIHAFGPNGGSLVTLPSGEIFVFSYDSYDLSTNGGEHWSTIQQSGFSTRTVIADSAGNLYAGENDPIYVSRDKGATWTKSNPGASPNFFDVSVLKLGPDSAIYAGNQGITGGYVYRSTDQGHSWRALHTESMSDVVNLDVYPSGSITVWYADKVIQSGDAGKTWTTLTYPRNEVYPAQSVFTDAKHGYALVDGRVVLTSDGGVTWDSSTSYFDHEEFISLFRGPGNTVLAGAVDGLYKLVESAALPPNSHRDSVVCYPNPASSTVTLTCEPNVQVQLYDATGREVLTHVTRSTTDALDVRALPAGAYSLVTRSAGAFHRRSIVIQH